MPAWGWGWAREFGAVLVQLSIDVSMYRSIIGESTLDRSHTGSGSRRDQSNSQWEIGENRQRMIGEDNRAPGCTSVATGV